MQACPGCAQANKETGHLGEAGTRKIGSCRQAPWANAGKWGRENQQGSRCKIKTGRGGGGRGREEGRVSQRRRKQRFLSGIGAVAWSSRSRHRGGRAKPALWRFLLSRFSPASAFSSTLAEDSKAPKPPPESPAPTTPAPAPAPAPSSRPLPPQSLEGLQPTGPESGGLERAPIQNSPWKETSLDHPYEKPRKSSELSSESRSGWGGRQGADRWRVLGWSRLGLWMGNVQVVTLLR